MPRIQDPDADPFAGRRPHEPEPLSLRWYHRVLQGLFILAIAVLSYVIGLFLFYTFTARADAAAIECIEGEFFTDEVGGLQVDPTWLESRAVRATMIGPFLNVVLDDNEEHITSIEVPVNAASFVACSDGSVTLHYPNEGRSDTTVLEQPWLTPDTTTPAQCAEDDPCWDCQTMGNRICGPVEEPDNQIGEPLVAYWFEDDARYGPR